ncbi:hypothetical protein FRC01_009378 [Tulasnella sp. 417]|nr:hypothetical protein FRC01_009378 [Tulasnella sp. 417]
MKLFIVIIIVLAYWPMVVGRSLKDRRVPAPIYAFSTNPCSFSDAFNMGRAGVQGLPTLHPADRDHNKATGQSAAVSIWTGFQVTSDCVLTSIGLPSLDLTHLQLQSLQSRNLHWWRIGSALMVQAVFNVAVYLLFVLSVGVALLSKPSSQLQEPIAQPLRKPVFVATVTRIPGSAGLGVHELVGKKQPSINVFTLQGRLVLYSEPTTSDSPAEWTVLFHGHGSYLPTWDPVKPNNGANKLELPHESLLDFLLHGISAYQPHTWYLPGIHVNVPRELAKELHRQRNSLSVKSINQIADASKRKEIHGQIADRSIAAAPARRKPTFAPSINRIGNLPVVAGAHKRIMHEQVVQQRVLVKRPARKPTFASSIHRIGTPQKPAVDQDVLAIRPSNRPAWIERFTTEGRLLLYSGSPRVDRSVEWRVIFYASSTRYLTRYGDESSNCQRDIEDGYLVSFLLCGFSIYHPGTSYPSIIVLAVSGENLKDSDILAVTNESLDITPTATDLPSSNPGNLDVAMIMDYSVPPFNTLSTSGQLDSYGETEALVALDPRQDRSTVEAVDEHIQTNAEDDVEDSRELLHPIDVSTPSSGGICPVAEDPEPPSSPNWTSLTQQHTATPYASDTVLEEQKAAVLRELRSVLALSRERALQHHAHGAAENNRTEGQGEGGSSGGGLLAGRGINEEAPARQRGR